MCPVASVVSNSFLAHGPDSSIHGILQARILERVAHSPPRDLPNPGIEPMSPASPALQVGSLPLRHWGSPKALQRLDVSHYRLTHCLVVLNLHMADTKNSSQKGSADKLQTCLWNPRPFRELMVKLRFLPFHRCTFKPSRWSSCYIVFKK